MEISPKLVILLHLEVITVIISHLVFFPQDDSRSVSRAPVWKDRVLSLIILVLCFNLCLYGEWKVIVSLYLLMRSGFVPCILLRTFF